VRSFAAFSFWLLLAAAYPGAGEGERVTIAHAGKEPGTLALTDGRIVRLMGVAAVSAGALDDIAGRAAALFPGDPPENRYGQILAHIVLPDGTWLQEKLVGEGKAAAMATYETRMEVLAPLLAAERTARAAKAGMWARANTPLVCADDAKRAFDRFAMIQGRVRKAANVRGTVYLTFGDDYRKDFTVKISAKTLKTLPEPIRRLPEDETPDAMIEARGYVFYNGGPMIEVTSPAQISLVPEDEENCP
jgi:Staphylococcal nuclease homologue